MRKHEKDENEIAAAVVAAVSGEKNPHAVAMAKARAAKLSPSRRQEIARTAAKKRWGIKKK